MEVSRENAKKTCSDTQGAGELHGCVDPVEGDPMSWAACVLPVYSHQLLHHSPIATRLEVARGGEEP